MNTDRTLNARVWRFVTKAMFRSVLGHVGDRPSDLEALTFASADGSRLEGMLGPAEGTPERVVLLCHPFTRRGFEFFLRGSLLASLRRSGAHVLLFNFKGFGRSAFGGANFADDVVGAVDYAASRFAGCPIYVLGLSFGGFHAVAALARRDGKVAAAFLDSVPVSPSDFFRKGPAHVFLRWVGGSRWAAFTGTEPISGKVGSVLDTQLCFVYGDRDEYADIPRVRQLLDRQSNVKFVTLAGLGHLEAFKQDSRGYLELVGSVLAPV